MKGNEKCEHQCEQTSVFYDKDCFNHSVCIKISFPEAQTVER